MKILVSAILPTWQMTKPKRLPVPWQNCKNDGQTRVACQYSPAMQNGEKIYETGKVCSGCKNLGMKCLSPEGLCEKPYCERNTTKVSSKTSYFSCFFFVA
ncbi:hypothetical protein Aduo_019479 [Ancylostoma duodenale]